MYLILTKTSDYVNISADVRPACSAVILSKLIFTWPTYVMSLFRDMLHSINQQNFHKDVIFSLWSFCGADEMASWAGFGTRAAVSRPLYYIVEICKSGAMYARSLLFASWPMKRVDFFFVETWTRKSCFQQDSHVNCLSVQFLVQYDCPRDIKDVVVLDQLNPGPTVRKFHLTQTYGRRKGGKGSM